MARMMSVMMRLTALLPVLVLLGLQQANGFVQLVAPVSPRLQSQRQAQAATSSTARSVVMRGGDNGQEGVSAVAERLMGRRDLLKGLAASIAVGGPLLVAGAPALADFAGGKPSKKQSDIKKYKPQVKKFWEEFQNLKELIGGERWAETAPFFTKTIVESKPAFDELASAMKNSVDSSDALTKVTEKQVKFFFDQLALIGNEVKSKNRFRALELYNRADTALQEFISTTDLE